eukprot:22562-Pelagococcus_subviridis.AAC.1
MLPPLWRCCAAGGGALPWLEAGRGGGARGRPPARARGGRNASVDDEAIGRGAKEREYPRRDLERRAGEARAIEDAPPKPPPPPRRRPISVRSSVSSRAFGATEKVTGDDDDALAKLHSHLPTRFSDTTQKE